MLTFDQFVNETELTEGVNDPSIFKAVFLAGGPGAGKSFIVGKTALQALGFKLINSDDAFEAGLKKAGLSTSPEDIASAQGQKIRGSAKALTGKKLQRALEGRLGLVVDGTGKDYNKIKGQVDDLRKLGYAVKMIFVNTDLETALKRNKMRPRSVPDKLVEKMWKDVQKNIGKFQGLFRNRMIIIDNSEEADIERSTLKAYKDIMTWAKKPPENSIAVKWIASQKPQKVEEAVQIKQGDTVRIKKQFADSPAEAKELYTVKELRGSRVLITPKDWKGGGIKPTEAVQMKMIEPAQVKEELVDEGKTGAKRLKSRLKKKGIDLDKRAKERKAEHERLKKQYEKV